MNLFGEETVPFTSVFAVRLQTCLVSLKYLRNFTTIWNNLEITLFDRIGPWMEIAVDSDSDAVRRR
jgi:hypothetical protein